VEPAQAAPENVIVEVWLLQAGEGETENVETGVGMTDTGIRIEFPTQVFVGVMV